MKKVNEKVWNRMYGILMEKGCTDIELTVIMKRWGELLHLPTEEARNRDELDWNLKTRIRKLKEKAESGEIWIVDQSMEMLKISSSISEDDIEQLKEYAHLEETRKMYDKVFISHSNSDKKYVTALVDFLEDIGMGKDNIFCTSIANYGVPINEDFEKRIKEQFLNHDIYVIFVLSDHYYRSPACLNEMGATWILQKDYTTVLLPGFEGKNIVGAINPRKIGIKLDDDKADIKERLKQLRDELKASFGLRTIEEREWDRRVGEFLNKIVAFP